MSGPAARLAPNVALALSMGLHELATNALKYGALSNAEGRVTLSWTYDPETRMLDGAWVESGGPPVVEPTRKGFGSRLIERSLRGELKGQAAMDYRPEGLRCLLNARLPEAPIDGSAPGAP
jgi:two-component sensor histidine kinase